MPDPPDKHLRRRVGAEPGSGSSSSSSSSPSASPGATSSSAESPEQRPGDYYSQRTLLPPAMYESRFVVLPRTFVRAQDGLGRHEAATVLCAAARGMAARSALRLRLAAKYLRVMDRASGYYFFRDLETGESSWHKPRMARPNGIPVEDPYKVYPLCSALLLHLNPHTHTLCT